MPPLTIMLKPSSCLCNLSCSYCFYKDVAANRSQESYGFMTHDTLSTILSKSFSYATDWFAIAFQGGEPTLVGLDFYKDVIHLVHTYNVNHLPVHYSIQTNGYQLNEKWASFFHDNQFLVGLSIDGIQDTHDIYRKNPLGDGTFAEIMKTVDLFNLHHVEYNILTVVTDIISSNIQEIYRFYQKNNFQFLQFIPCIRPFENASSPVLLSKEAYGQFLCNLFDLWYNDVVNGTLVSIRQFENYLMILNGFPAESCDMSGSCTLQFIIEANGDVYPCDFYVLDAYKLGNLVTDSFDAILNNTVSDHFLLQGGNTPPDCTICEYYFLCKGGCRRYRQMAFATEPHFFCDSFKTLFKHSINQMNLLCGMLQNS